MTTPPLPRPARRSPFSFLRSLFFSSPPADSSVSAHPTPPKSFFDRIFRKSPPRPLHHPGSEIQLSFFDDDAGRVHNVLDRRALSRLSISRRTDSARTAHSISRLSSAFAHTSPDLSSDSSVVPTSCSIAEQRDTPRSDSQTDLPSPKASPGFRLRTKLSLTKLVSPNSQPSSSTKSSVAPSSFSYHPYSTTISDDVPSHPPAVQPPRDRSFTPEDDPFRKDEVAPALLAFSGFPDSSPKSASIQTNHLTNSRSLPVLPSGRSADLDSPSPSAHTLTESEGSPSKSSPSQSTSRTPAPPSQGPMSPLSLSFPLPPSPQSSVSVPVLTVQVTTPAPCPPPAYPPPLSPPPLEPSPCPPPVGVGNAPPPEPLEGSPKGRSSRRRSGRDSSKPVAKSTPAGQARRRHAHSHSPANRSPSSFATQYMIASSRAEDRDFQRILGKRALRKKDRPLTPFPTPLFAGKVRHDPTGRLQALKAAPCLTPSQTDPVNDETAEAMSDSEVEPDLDFNSNKARKKISVSSGKSTQSAISNNSTTSESTTTSSTSIATASTAATTVSPSTSTHTSVDKTCPGPQVFITNEDGTTVSTEQDNHA